MNILNWSERLPSLAGYELAGSVRKRLFCGRGAFGLFSGMEIYSFINWTGIKTDLKSKKVLDIACQGLYYRIINRLTVEKGLGYEKRRKKKTGAFKDRIPDVP